MKKVLGIITIILICVVILLFTGCSIEDNFRQNDYVNSFSKDYVSKYTDFMQNVDMTIGLGFPIKGYYLFDLNFDNIPELGILSDSCGSLGAFLTLYYYNGKEIMPILDENNNPVTISSNIQILADYQKEEVFLMKELYMLQGNGIGTSGSIAKIITNNGIPFVNSILSLAVNQECNLENYDEASYKCENDYLSDIELDDCLITQYYADGKWSEISSSEYLSLKEQLLAGKNTFINLCEIDTNISLCESIDELVDENGEYINIRIINDKIVNLFQKWFDFIK